MLRLPGGDRLELAGVATMMRLRPRWPQALPLSVAFLCVVLALAPRTTTAQVSLESVEVNEFIDLPTAVEQPLGVSWGSLTVLDLAPDGTEPLFTGLLFGGARVNTALHEPVIMSNTTWVFSETLLTWSPCYEAPDAPRPAPRLQHVAEPNQSLEKLYIFGGTSDPTTFEPRNDLWELTILAKPFKVRYSFQCQWRRIESQGLAPSPRMGSGGTMFQNHIFIFGGCGAADPEFNTYAFSRGWLYQCLETHRLDEVWHYDIQREAWNLVTFTGARVPQPSNLAYVFGYGEGFSLVMSRGFIRNATTGNIKFSGETLECSLADDLTTGTCVDGPMIPQHINRGAEVVLNRARKEVMFVGVLRGDTRVSMHILNGEVSGQLHLVSSVNAFRVPAINGLTGTAQPFGGFHSIWFTNPYDLFLFGNMYDSIEGTRQSSWRAQLFTTPVTPSSQYQVSWTHSFHFTRITARAFPVLIITEENVIIHGGFSATEVETTWAVQPDTRTDQNATQTFFWHRIDSPLRNAVTPPSRYGHIGSSLNRTTFFIGGGRKARTNTCYSDGWTFDIPTRIWTKVTDSVPPVRGATLTEYQGKYYHIGGGYCDGTISSDVHVMTSEAGDFTFRLLERKPIWPSPIAYHVAAVRRNHVNQDELIIYGGHHWPIEAPSSTETTLSTVWAMNLETFEWRAINFPHSTNEITPAPRVQHCGLPLGSFKLMVIGGRGAREDFDDVWVYNHRREAWTAMRDRFLRRTVLDTPVYGSVCGENNNFVYTLGGTTNDEFFSDTQVLQPACNAGNEGDIVTEACMPCARGTFRNDLRTLNCSVCLFGTTTVSTGAVISRQCDMCREGHCNGFNGVVQSGDGAFFCECNCGWGFHGDQCQFNNRPAVYGGVFGTLIVLIVVSVTLRYFFVKNKLIKKDVELNKLLLEETTQQYQELERAMVITPDELEFKDILAEGGFGSVYLAFWKTQDKLVAVKKLRESILLLDELSKEDFIHEIRFARTLHHRNIVWFYGANMLDPTNQFLVMEYVERGCLTDILADASIELDDVRKRSFMLDTARGMEYLHTRDPPRIHRDLKSFNLLVSSHWVVKVSDFTTAKRLVGLDADTSRFGRRESNASRLSGSRHSSHSEIGPSKSDGAFSRLKRFSLRRTTGGARGSNRVRNREAFSAVHETMLLLPEDHPTTRDGTTALVPQPHQHPESGARSGRALPLASITEASDGEVETAHSSAQHGTKHLDSSTKTVAEQAQRQHKRHKRHKLLITNDFGTLLWSAPEVLRKSHYDLSVDVYSFGIVVCEIVTRTLPFEDCSDANIRKAIIDGLRPSYPGDTPEFLVTLMKQCWTEKNFHRPSFTEVVAMLEDYDKECASASHI